MLTATEQREVVALAREFAREKIEPFAAEWDRTAHFPRDVIDEMGKLGRKSGQGFYAYRD